MKKRQPTNHDSLTAIKSKNKNNKKPEKSIPNNRYEGLFAREERKMQEVEVIKTEQVKESIFFFFKSKARLDFNLEAYPI